MKKTYKIQKIRDFGLQNRPTETTEIEGTLEYLIDYFSYTLQCGNSWNKKIKRVPKTIKSFITNVNDSFREIQRGYNSTRVKLIEN
jgi:hypothetical protein